MSKREARDTVTQKRLLLTGYEPFGGSNVNPSQMIAERLDGISFGELQVIGRVIRLEYATIEEQLTSLVDEISPDIILLTGQYGGADISLERVGINLADAEQVGYNCGTKPDEERLIEDAPDAYFTSVDVKSLRNMLREQGIPAHVSLSAGSFGCNQIYFYGLHLGAKHRIPVLFIHLPHLPEQSVKRPRVPSMCFDLQLNAVRQAIQFLAEH